MNFRRETFLERLLRIRYPEIFNQDDRPTYMQLTPFEMIFTMITQRISGTLENLIRENARIFKIIMFLIILFMISVILYRVLMNRAKNAVQTHIKLRNTRRE